MKRILFAFVILFLAESCGKKSNNNPGEVPTAAQLLLPAQNEVCTTGTIVSDSISAISFSWNTSANSDSYTINVKNLLNGQTSSATTNTPAITMQLKRNTPWSWFVISHSVNSTATAQSDTWKFYNAGNGTTSYAPYPADLLTPAAGAILTTTSINLTWKGAAVDTTTIVNYDVYFGTTATPPLYKSAVTASFLNNINVDINTTYYWSISTRDINGNVTASATNFFSIN